VGATGGELSLSAEEPIARKGSRILLQSLVVSRQLIVGRVIRWTLSRSPESNKRRGRRK
jgi:hypothetical protein